MPPPPTPPTDTTPPAPGARLVDRLVLGALAGLVLFWLGASVAVPGVGVADGWLPVALLLGLALPVRAVARPRAPGRLVLAGGAAVAVAFAAVAYGALATPSRSWDGAASFDAKVHWLTAAPTLAQPFFADPGVFHHSPDYPLLLPLLVACTERLVPGAGRLVLPLVYLLLLGVVATVLGRARIDARLSLAAVLAVALTPALLGPGGGAVDSGYGEVFLLVATTSLAGGFVLRSALWLALGTALAILAKPEGHAYALVAALVAFGFGERRLLAAVLGAAAAAIVSWLPVQARLLHLPPEGDLARTSAWLAGILLLGALAFVADAAARRSARPDRLRWALAAGAPSAVVVALPVLAPLLPAGEGVFAVYAREASHVWTRLGNLGDYAVAFVGYAFFKLHLGATFVLPFAAAIALRGRGLHRAAPMVWAFCGFGLLATAVPFVLSPESDLDHHLRSSLPRLLLHWLGPLWLLSAVAMHAVVHGERGESVDLLRLLVPVGSRRDRIVWIARVTIAKLREGPGPWLRAVKKGLYQLLPPRWQQRILRWTGQEQFFRRDAARHAGADAGVERPGLVSVVLPVYDQADMVGAAIDSVLAQTYAPFELIVVDDGSRDGVAAVLRRYAGDPRVRLLTQPNQGLPKALSTGFETATGEFFTWTSADNLMHRDQLTRLVAFLRAQPDVAMVYADYEVIGEDDAPLVGGEFRVMDRTDKRNLAAVRVSRHTHDLNRYEDNFIGPCFLYRGQVGRLIGDYNPELGLEDYDYWMRINRLFRIEHLGTDELLYRYRVHDNTLSARSRELRIQERARVLMDYERRRGEWLAAPLHVLADAANLTWLRDCIAAGDRLEALADDGWRRVAGKTLVVVDGRSLRGLPVHDLPVEVGVAAFFASAEEAHAEHLELGHPAVAAFAATADVAARLAVYTRAVFLGRPGADAFALAVRHAGNGTFFRSTRDAERLRRAVPQPLPGEAPLRVLLQVDTFARGGLERVVADLALCLHEEGVEVGLCVVDGRFDAARAILPAGVECVGPPGAGEQAWAAMLRAGRWQVVSAHESVAGAAAAAAAGVPFVQVVHNSYVWFDAERIAAYRAADAHTAAYACVSAQALAYADLRLGLDVQKMLVVGNGIDATPAAPVPRERLEALRAELGLAAGDAVFLQVASVQPAKAHRVAVHALAALHRRQPRARLVCLGHEMNPVHAAAVRGDVARLGLGDAVVFAGHRDDAAPFFALADAFVLPSFWEGCSLAVWEAIRAGLPLVLADVGAAREQLRHGHGELVAPPFDSMFDLDAQNLGALVGTVREDHAERLAAAMERALALPRAAAPKLPDAADRRTMARRHALLYGWLRQGGVVAGARALTAR